jgi:hypothetical protein
MNPHSYAHLIFDKGAKNIWWRKDIFQQILLEKLDSFLWETESRSMFVTLYKYQFKVD